VVSIQTQQISGGDESGRYAINSPIVNAEKIQSPKKEVTNNDVCFTPID